MDTSGDGTISTEEVEQMMAGEKTDVKALLAAMEIDPSDMKVLFEMFDDGDGEINMEEFLMGASRLKGPAKNIDMAKLMAQMTRIEHDLKNAKKLKEVNHSPDVPAEGHLSLVCTALPSPNAINRSFCPQPCAQPPPGR